MVSYRGGSIFFVKCSPCGCISYVRRWWALVDGRHSKCLWHDMMTIRASVTVGHLVYSDSIAMWMMCYRCLTWTFHSMKVTRPSSSLSSDWSLGQPRAVKPSAWSASGNQLTRNCCLTLLANCLIYSEALLEYVIVFCCWSCGCVLLARGYRPWNSRKKRCSFSLFSVKNAKIVQLWV